MSQNTNKILGDYANARDTAYACDSFAVWGRLRGGAFRDNLGTV